MDYVRLNNGVKMPMQGFGVFQVSDAEICEKAVSDALSVGYRLIDTASVYGNEKAVCEAIRKSDIPREELFITTKAWVTEMGYESTMTAFNDSLVRLGLEYIDLYLVHMPFGDYYGAWRAMEKIYEEGKAHAIGVCNFEPDRLVDLCHSAKVKPMVNQIEMHPYTQKEEAIELMLSLGVQPEAWGPLAEGRNSLFNDTVLAAIAHKYGKTVAQVILRWHLQRGVVAIPKSVHSNRMEENFSVADFVLSDEDMAEIASLDTGKSLILDLRSTAEIDRLYAIECNN